MTTSRRPRRNADEVQAAIRDAVVAQIREYGYASVTFEGVARRAHTSKAVLYRRYPDRVSMVSDTLFSLLENLTALPPTGSLRSDLIAWLQGATARARILGAESYRRFLGEADTRTLNNIRAENQHVVQLLEDFVIAPARERGELGPKPFGPEVIYAPIRLLRDRVLFGEGDIKISAFVDELAIPLLRGASGWLPRDDPKPQPSASIETASTACSIPSAT